MYEDILKAKVSADNHRRISPSEREKEGGALPAVGHSAYHSWVSRLLALKDGFGT